MFSTNSGRESSDFSGRLVWRGDHLLQSINPVQSDGSQIAGLPLHRLVGAGSHPLWCFLWAIDELVQAE